jgi:hypothetical protein
MEGFDTISLESNSCDICEQDTGEELIDCILNDRCLQVSESSGGVEDDTNSEPHKRAHKDCLDKWKSVIQASLTSRCPSPKRSWKDKIKDLLNRNDESNVSDAWVQVECGPKISTGDENSKTLNFKANSKQNNNRKISEKNNFLTNEEYRIERTEHEIGCCEERARKLRVRSVDKEDEDIEEDLNESLRSANEDTELEVFQTSCRLEQRMCVYFSIIYLLGCYLQVH